jgi:leader peptidase (prepilin peptidase)/N-methyltransferase
METILTLLPLFYVAATALPLVLVDIKEHRLPNKIVLPMISLTLLTQLTLAIWTGAWASLGISVGLGFSALAIGIYLNYKQWVGMGDIKLMAGLTMIASWFTVLGGALLMPMSLAVGVIVAVIVALAKRVTHLPMGPTILATFSTIMAVTLI